MSPLNELRKLLIPPDEPVGVGSPSEWAALERSLGTRLPSDYKEFVSIYGLGSIDVYFFVLNPFMTEVAESYTLEYGIARQRQSYPLNLQYASDYPDGLIPWGQNSERGYCFWDTSNADPDRWTIFTEADDWTFRHPEDMTTFLLTVLTGVHLSPVFKSEFRPFRLPVYYYPWYQPVMLVAELAPSRRLHDDSVESLRSLAPMNDLEYRPFNGTTVEHDLLVPPHGWQLSFRSTLSEDVNSTSGLGERYCQRVTISLPEADIERAKELIRRLSKAIGAEIVGIRRMDTHS